MKKRFSDLIIFCAQNGFTDIHLRGGQPIVYRKDGLIKFDQKNIWSYQDVDALILSILNPKNMAMLRERWSVDFAATVGNVRIRLNIFNTDLGPSLAIRLLPSAVPTIEKLNLHPSVESISDMKSGLVLICGTTGCGKTTTIASILNDINHKRATHMVTLEDPIEYRIQSRLSYVEQRELGTHVPSIQRGLIDVLREDPDVIMVGELREPENIALTLDAAESGHLVIATLHATSVEDALYRIINSAPLEAEEYVRHQLASTISWIIVQKLVYIEKIGFRLPLLSILRGSQQIKGLIREKKIYQIENAMHSGKADGLFTEERYLHEYLEVKDTHHNPIVNFRPEKGVLVDSAYKSSIFDDGFDSKAKIKHSQEVSFEGMPPKSVKLDMDDQRLNLLDAEKTLTIEPAGSEYVIHESDDLSEIIAQTEKNFKNKR